ncbi:TPA: UDP-N-acetylglucosamine 2-epimerase [Streptococcus suis]
MKKICFVTGSRAEYGIMRSLLSMLEKDEDVQLDIVVTAMHLEEKYGYTIKDIEADNLHIVKKIPLYLENTSKHNISKSLATLTEGLVDLFEDISYDLVIILGDRYEMLPIANVALIYNIPICHIHGGEKTLGNFDEAIRHSITKMSQLHLTATEEFRKRVIQLGETPFSVHNIGSMGVENVIKQRFLSKDELATELGVSLEDNYFVVLFHPVTFEDESAERQTRALLSALEMRSEQCIVIGSNSDTQSDIIMELMNEFVTRSQKHKLFSSLPTQYYHSLVKYSKGLVGNSSSGLIEVPSLKIPTLNIGNRQLGRLAGPSVVHVSCTEDEIKNGLQKLNKISDFFNPYEKENSIENAYFLIKKYISESPSTMKEFYDIELGDSL